MARTVRTGGTVIFPTDTVYGLGCDPQRLQAIAQIYALKVRDAGKPLALHFASVNEALEFARGNGPALHAIRAFLPGPLTVIVERPGFVAPEVTAGLPSVGLRVPDHALCRALLARCGPLAGTSANYSGEPAFMGEGSPARLPRADLFIDDGPTPRRGPSTVLDCSQGAPRLIREGVLTVKTLEATLGPIARALCAALIAFALVAGAAVAQSPAKAGAAPKAAAPKAAAPKAAAPPAAGAPGLENFAGFDSIKTDTIDWNANTGDFSIPKHFTASRSGSDVSADRATGNSKQKIVHATGNVVVHQMPSPGSARNSKLGSDPSTLTADKLDADGTRKLYTATGHVHFTQGARDATADSGTLDDQSGMLHMQGNVHVKDGEQYLDANDVVYNTHSGDLKATGNVLVRAPAETPPPSGPASAPAKTAPPKKP